MRTLLVTSALLISLLAMPTAGVAQHQPPSFERWEPPGADAPADNLHLADSRPPNYGLVGGLIGGAIGVGLGALAGNALKNNGRGGDGAIVLVGAMGGLIGGLIGYGFGRESERHAAEPRPGAANAP